MKSEFIILNTENIVSGLSNFFILFLVAKLLGTAMLGTYTLVISLTFIFGNGADLSLSPLILSKLSKHQQKETNNLISFNLTAATFFYVLLLLTAYFFYYKYFWLILFAGLTQIISTLSYVYICIYQNKNRLTSWAIQQIVFRLFFIFSMSITLIITKNLLTMFAIGCAACLVYCYIYTSRLYNLYHHFKFSLKSFSTIYKETLTFALGLILSIILSQIDKLVLYKYVSLSEIGIYSLSNKIILIFFTLSVILSRLFLPKLIKSTKNSKTHKHWISTYYFYTISSALFICLCIVILSPLFINIFFGNIYKPAIFLTQTMTIYLFFYLLSSVPGNILTALGYQQDRNTILFFAIIFYLLLSQLLIPRLGLIALTYIYSFVFVFIFIFNNILLTLRKKS